METDALASCAIDNHNIDFSELLFPSIPQGITLSTRANSMWEIIDNAYICFFSLFILFIYIHQQSLIYSYFVHYLRYFHFCQSKPFKPQIIT